MNEHSLIFMSVIFLLGLLTDYMCFSVKIPTCTNGEMDSACLEPQTSNTEPEVEWKKRMAAKYLTTLENHDRENWLDPTDMLHFEGLDYGEPYFPEISPLKGKNAASNENSNSRPLEYEKVSKEVVFSDGNDISIKRQDEELQVQSEEMLKLTTEVKKTSCSLNDIYISRWLKKLLIKIESSLKWGETGMSYVQFPITSKLTSAMDETIKKQPLNIQPLDDIVSDAISDSVIVQNDQIIQQNFNFFYLYKTEIIVISIILLFFILYCLLVRCPKLTLFGFFVAICVFWHWMDLYQEKLAEKHYQLETMDYQAECIKKDLSVVQRIGLYFKSFFVEQTDCKKYYKALVVDPIWEVSLSVAVSETISSCILQPLKVSSRVANYCIKELFSDLSILLIFIVTIFLFLILMMLCQYRIRFPWFFAALEPAKNTNRIQNVSEIQMKSPSLSNVMPLRHVLYVVKGPDFDHVEEMEERTKISVKDESEVHLKSKNKSHQLQKAISSVDCKIPKRHLHARSKSFCGLTENEAILIKASKQ